MSNEDNTRLETLDNIISNPERERNSGKQVAYRQSSYNENSNNVPLRFIQTRCEFITFGEVDTFREQFKANVLIRSRWLEKEDIEEYDPKEHWNPLIYIQNLIPEKFYENVRYRCVKQDDGTEITEIRSCKGTFWERMELMDFPLDIQELSIIVESKHNPRHVTILPDSERISRMNIDTLNSFRDQQKFKLYKMVRTSQTASYDESNKMLNKIVKSDPLIPKRTFPRRSKFVATCFVSRNPGYYMINAFSFNCLITILTLTLFIIDVESADKRITGTFKLILTLFTFKIVTSKALPTISYLTSLDKYQLVNILYLGLCCGWHSIIASLNYDHGTKTRIDTIAMGALILFFVIIHSVFIFQLVKSYQKIQKLKREEAVFDKHIASYPYDLEEYDDD